MPSSLHSRIFMKLAYPFMVEFPKKVFSLLRQPLHTSIGNILKAPSSLDFFTYLGQYYSLYTGGHRNIPYHRQQTKVQYFFSKDGAMG